MPEAFVGANGINGTNKFMQQSSSRAIGTTPYGSHGTNKMMPQSSKVDMGHPNWASFFPESKYDK
eukprot:8161829-Karenia_brevis.AAC.1